MLENKLNKEELIALLKSDVDKFNNYREDTEYEKIDLSHADLRSADLRGADLCGADLCGANLYDADLRNADLRNADLRNANIDYSSGLSLWCGSFNIQVDIEQVKQLLYHICRLQCEDEQFKIIKDINKEYANQSSVIKRHGLDKII